MKTQKTLSVLMGIGILTTACLAAAQNKMSQLEVGQNALHKMAGCYVVDYSYTETEGLKPGYTRDSRVYDVNSDKTVRELIYTEDVAPDKIRLQHILFATDLQGQMLEGSMLKHTGEDWVFQPKFYYDFTAQQTWTPIAVASPTDTWSRAITNLDDGPRYQCLGSWTHGDGVTEFDCNSEAPIPGRETRDMHRKDYNTLRRSNRLMVYGNSFLERENNIKIQDDKGTKTLLAKEVGKNWYVRAPDSDCQAAQQFVNAGQPFWTLVREVWQDVMVGDRPFVESNAPFAPPRYAVMWKVEEQYHTANLQDPTIRAQAKAAIRKVIDDNRVRN